MITRSIKILYLGLKFKLILNLTNNILYLIDDQKPVLFTTVDISVDPWGVNIIFSPVFILGIDVYFRRSYLMIFTSAKSSQGNIEYGVV